jgi:hypothetical protein
LLFARINITANKQVLCKYQSKRKERMPMSRTYKDSPDNRQARTRGGRTRPRNISVRAVRRDPPDLRKLSRAIITLALARADADVQAAANNQADKPADTAPAAEESPDGR